MATPKRSARKSSAPRSAPPRALSPCRRALLADFALTRFGFIVTQWRHLLTAHPELVLEPDGEVQVVMKENQRLLSAIGADSKAAAGYAGPQLWGMYKKTCDELQKHQKENQKR